MTNHRIIRPRGTRRVPAVLAAAALAAGVLVTGTQMSSSATEPSSTSVSLNRLEREAHLHLLAARREQVQQENRQTAGAQHPIPSAEACRALLSQTWRKLGRFSDGYETYLMRRPPCAGL